MITVTGGAAAYFDIDGTLVFPANEVPVSGLGVVCIHERLFHVHQDHIETLKDFHARGITVILWSAAGAEWCQKVALALNIDKYVTVCLKKPSWYFDDLTVDKFMPELIRSYKRPA